MSARSWIPPVLGGLITTGLGIAINLATELKFNAWAWVAVIVLTGAGVLLGTSTQRWNSSRHSNGTPTIINRGTLVAVEGEKNRVKVNAISPAALIATSLMVIVAVVAGLLAGRTFIDDVERRSPATQTSSTGAEDKLFDVTVLDEPTATVAYGSAAGYLFSTGTVPSLPAPEPLISCSQWSTWALDKGGTRVGETDVAFTVAALGDHAVRVHTASLHVDRRDGPVAGDRISCVEGGPIPVSHLRVDLDRQQATYTYPEGGSLGGASRPFALQIPPGEAEQVAIEAMSLECYCSWYLELLIEANGVEYRHRVDNDGEPFVTAPLRGNYTNYRYDSVSSRWELGMG